MSTLFLTNQNTQAVSTEKHLVELWLVTWQPARHFLALPIALRNIKCHNTQNTTVITQLLITTQKKQRCLLYCFVVCHLFSNALRRKRKHVIFAHFQSQTPFTSIKHIYLLPSRMPSPLFNFGSSPLGRWWRHLHHLRRGGRYLHHLQWWQYHHQFFITTKARNHQLTHSQHTNGLKNSMPSTYHTFFSLSLTC